MYIDRLNPINVQVGFGTLGINGDLGYENKKVVVRGRHYSHALSTHPPARLRFQLDGRHNTFRCHVAINDDVQAGLSHADFTVLVDGKIAASALHTSAGERPRLLTASIAGAHTLELVVQTSRWEFCHAVWLDPELDTTPIAAAISTLTDCLGRTQIDVPSTPIRARHCLATVASRGFENWLDDLIGSFYANGNCHDARVVVFTVGASEGCDQIIAKYKAIPIRCQPRHRLNPTLKSVLYSVARVVQADQYICLDADMLVLDELQPIYAALDVCPPGTILACREGNGNGFKNLGHVLTTAYGGSDGDLKLLLGSPNGEHAYSLVVNDGLFAGSHAAFLALDGVIRTMHQADAWVDQYRHIQYRNQFIFNLALARLNCGVELDATYNVQLHVHDVDLSWRAGKIRAQWNGLGVRILHFSGNGRNKYPKWRGLFAAQKNPLASPANGDSYIAFLSALRTWVGRFGATSLTMSFYGTADGYSAEVRDPGDMPLFGLLHYLIRANGCTRVLETGTARGVSAACLASAVAHRPGGRVVTIDVHPLPERQDLWQALPQPVQACIEQRVGDSISEMKMAVAAGERYEAALLDSLHTTEHVWAEFQLATQLVCPSGLILIHDVNNVHGTVEAALKRIEAAGYGITRLWSAESGVREENNLGLAVIENRQRNQQSQPII